MPSQDVSDDKGYSGPSSPDNEFTNEIDSGSEQHGSHGQESTIQVYSAGTETDSIHDDQSGEIKASEIIGAISPQRNVSFLSFPGDSTENVPLHTTDRSIPREAEPELELGAVDAPHDTSTQPEKQAFRRAWGDFARRSLVLLDDHWYC